MKVLSLYVIAVTFLLLPNSAMSSIVVEIPPDVQRGVDSNDAAAMVKASEYYFEAACPTEGEDGEVNTLRSRKSLRQGIVLLDKAAQMGNVAAAQKLGDVYVGQHCGTRNVEKALEYYHIAAKANVPEAVLALGLLYAQVNKHAEAYEWLKSAAGNKNPNAFLALSSHYLYGYTEAIDMARAYVSLQIYFLLAPDMKIYMKSRADDIETKLTEEDKKVAQKMLNAWNKGNMFE